MIYLSVWALEFLPYMDLPLHTYMAKVMSTLGAYDGAYYIKYDLMPNQLWQWVLAGMSWLFSPVLAMKIVLTLAYIVSVIGCYFLSRVYVERISFYWLWIFAAAQFHYFFFLGFVQFYLSLALIPWVLLGLHWLKLKPKRTAVFLAVCVFAFFLMHFKAMAVLLLSLMMYEVLQIQSLQKFWARLRLYLPAFLVIAILVALIPSANAGDPIFTYHWLKKFLSPALWLLKPTVLMAVLLASLGLALLTVKLHVLFRSISISAVVALVVCILVFFILPSQLRAMADAELRIFYPMTILLIMWSLMLIQRHSPYADLVMLSTGIFYTMCFGLLYQSISIKHDDLLALRQQIENELKPTNTSPLMVNYLPPPGSGIGAAMQTSIYGLFHKYQYHEFLYLSPQDPRKPYVFTTSVLRRSKDEAYSKEYDYILPWGDGDFSADFYSEKALVKSSQPLVIPITAGEKAQAIIGDRQVVRSQHWMIAF